jgi:DNA polymerase III epsilon subunit-like protein
MAKTMTHWNGHQLCAVDVETSGTNEFWHEILQICILPLDSMCRPRKDVIPFYIEIKPEFPNRVDPEAMSITRLNLAKITHRGFEQEAARDLLLDWIKKLELPITAYGRSKCIMPLGHNYVFDRGFIRSWLGSDFYDTVFWGHYRDTMEAALYMNDRAAMHAEKVPFPKVSLAALCNKLNVDYDPQKAHDALEDCVATAECYRRLLQKGLLV